MRSYVCVFALLVLAACPEVASTVPSGTVVSVPDAPGAPAPVRPMAQPSATGPIVGLRAQPLQFTRHGRCRMDCRHISEAEVGEILNGAGELDPSRTRHDGRCPSYALEGRTSDGQRVRIVYAGCEDRTKVITVIDLDREWPCGDC
ncbi:MAG: DUF4258 domain-containing protein [Myxococcota bacterium]